MSSFHLVETRNREIHTLFFLVPLNHQTYRPRYCTSLFSATEWSCSFCACADRCYPGCSGLSPTWPSRTCLWRSSTSCPSLCGISSGLSTAMTSSARASLTSRLVLSILSRIERGISKTAHPMKGECP